MIWSRLLVLKQHLHALVTEPNKCFLKCSLKNFWPMTGFSSVFGLAILADANLWWEKFASRSCDFVSDQASDTSSQKVQSTLLFFCVIWFVQARGQFFPSKKPSAAKKVRKQWDPRCGTSENHPSRNRLDMPQCFGCCKVWRVVWLGSCVHWYQASNNPLWCISSFRFSSSFPNQSVPSAMTEVFSALVTKNGGTLANSAQGCFLGSLQQASDLNTSPLHTSCSSDAKIKLVDASVKVIFGGERTLLSFVSHWWSKVYMF